MASPKFAIMKRIPYNLIILLILLSIFAIILSQGWLLYKQYEYKERVFQDTITNLLFEVKLEIEASITPDQNNNLENKYYFNINSPDSAYFSQFIFLEDYNYASTTNYQVDINLIKDRSTQIKELFYELRATAPGRDTLERIVVEYVQAPNTNSVVNSVDFIDTENLVKTKMTAYNIALPFHLGIKDNENGWIWKSSGADTTMLLASSYQETILSDTEQLYLAFPKKADYFFKQLTFHILGTILVILLVFSSFWYVLSILLEQKKLSELKDDFINNMSHEFKTPIATIAFAAATIENEKILNTPAEILKFTKVIKEENKRMNGQVEQVLKAAIADRKPLELQMEAFELHAVIEQLADAIDIKVKNKNGQLIRQLHATKSNVIGDKMQLSNVISNLLDNAQKYSLDNPTITIRTKNVDHAICISIIDNGKGMTEEEQQRVFDKFYRVPTGKLHKVKGFGLGLSYAKAVIEQHGGKITLKSTIDKGSDFTVVLPYDKSNE